MDFLDTVLIVGSGGREHAIQKALLRSNRAICMYAYPGNPGMESDGCILIDKDHIKTWDDLAKWASANDVNLAVIGPEQPLVEGLTDTLKNKGIAVFGPSKKAARIEGSKRFAKDLMSKYNIPTADYKTFESKEEASSYVEEKGGPLVVKVSGLAAGKGAIVCDTTQEALDALERIYESGEFKDAGKTVVIEEKMEGEEASVFILTDGANYKLLPVSQDHKTIYEGDKGSNTGGMGAYAPAPLVDSALLERIEREIVVPTLKAMSDEGSRYSGLLYAGLMITEDGPRVIEFNCRFGDPETQAVLPLIEADWYELFMACSEGRLDSVGFTVKDMSCVNVVLASGGYPGSYEKGKVITGIEEAEKEKENVDIYQAGTANDESGNLVSSGGRVLSLSAWAKTLKEAVDTAYSNLEKVKFEGRYYRKDIASKGLAREAGKNKKTEVL